MLFLPASLPELVSVYLSSILPFSPVLSFLLDTIFTSHLLGSVSAIFSPFVLLEQMSALAFLYQVEKKAFENVLSPLLLKISNVQFQSFY